MKTLYKLISSGYYKGEIQENRFDLMRTDFVVNHKIIGVLNSNGKFDTKSINKNPLAFNIFLIISTILSTLSFFNFIWIVSLIFVIFLIPILGMEYYKRRKEMNIFTSKFLSFHDNSDSTE